MNQIYSYNAPSQNISNNQSTQGQIIYPQYFKSLKNWLNHYIKNEKNVQCLNQITNQLMQKILKSPQQIIVYAIPQSQKKQQNQSIKKRKIRMNICQYQRKIDQSQCQYHQIQQYLLDQVIFLRKTIYEIYQNLDDQQFVYNSMLDISNTIKYWDEFYKHLLIIQDYLPKQEKNKEEEIKIKQRQFVAAQANPKKESKKKHKKNKKNQYGLQCVETPYGQEKLEQGNKKEQAKNEEKRQPTYPNQNFTIYSSRKLYVDFTSEQLRDHNRLDLHQTLGDHNIREKISKAINSKKQFRKKIEKETKTDSLIFEKGSQKSSSYYGEQSFKCNFLIDGNIDDSKGQNLNLIKRAQNQASLKVQVNAFMKDKGKQAQSMRHQAFKKQKETGEKQLKSLINEVPKKQKETSFLKKQIKSKRQKQTIPQKYKYPGSTFGEDEDNEGNQVQSIKQEYPQKQKETRPSKSTYKENEGNKQSIQSENASQFSQKTLEKSELKIKITEINSFKQLSLQLKSQNKKKSFQKCQDWAKKMIQNEKTHQIIHSLTKIFLTEKNIEFVRNNLIQS